MLLFQVALLCGGVVTAVVSSIGGTSTTLSQFSSASKRRPEWFEGCHAETENFSFSPSTDAGKGIGGNHVSRNFEFVDEEKGGEDEDQIQVITLQDGGGGCGEKEIPLEFFDGDVKPSVSCCPVASRQCSGCVKYDKSKNKCVQCRPGWVSMCANSACKERLCVSCKDLPYADTDGQSCPEICPKEPRLLTKKETSDIRMKGTEGISADIACCACGGGIKQPTPFSYSDSVDLRLGEKVEIFPSPRTASHYAVSSDCNLQVYR
uniref:TNFR-Cys domain-containing protein n=1 Tax=Chromera velia CCMP2878 TaxID=1169474 RepID=A0A0K6S7L0_9ALVE|eukprot:Cvel_22239.t1-p1 / transcript=Cvel_22239.t1 / gene=Cvel_22239 / organism=Chromera_velia_CCMP2878 / gene_product=hypothetical protein / transcript_product=hypothetical protein / location=Cvel_scaffold2165:3705-5027(+) / protein_length=262 / sequence_SO=supercontig / SO=protein_coding / is_pseudo=false